MKKEYKIVIAIPALLLLFVFFLFPSKKIDKQLYMLQKYKDVENKILNNKNKNGEINNKNIKIKIDNDTEASFYKNDKIIYGQVYYKGTCIEKNINGNVKIYDKRCEKFKLPEKASDIILKESAKSIVNDNIDTGLDENDEFSSKYYFIGNNPNNHLIAMDNCWQIVNISQNNSIKIVYNGPVLNNKCKRNDNDGSIAPDTWDIKLDKIGDWEQQSTLAKKMYYWDKDNLVDVKNKKIKLEKKYIENAEWNIGSIGTQNITLIQDVKNERKKKYVSSIGLLNASDYLKISCKYSSSMSDESCGYNNYLFKAKYHWWTINNVDIPQKNVWIVSQSGNVENKSIKLSHEYYFSGIRLALYLKSDIKMIGMGQEDNPYLVVK